MIKEEIITTYKGFDENLKCKDYQFEIGKSYEEKGKIKACNNGFHACPQPLDVFSYYSPTTNRFAEVEQSGTLDKSESDKICSSKITIKGEINLFNLLKIGVEKILSTVNWKDNKATNTGYSSAATNTGDRSAATNTGYRSAATNTGDSSAATNTGNRSAATNTGYRSAATNTGDSSAATNTGYSSAATNTGYSSAATNTGDRSAATNTGYSSVATVEGKNSIACGLGIRNRAKASKGSWIVLVEWIEENDKWTIKDIKTAKIDGKKLKADTFYELKKGKFIKSKK